MLVEPFVKTIENRIVIKLDKADGRKVLLSFNVFGGSAAWKDFPDSAPVKADERRGG